MINLLFKTLHLWLMTSFIVDLRETNATLWLWDVLNARGKKTKKGINQSFTSNTWCDQRVYITLCTMSFAISRWRHKHSVRFQSNRLIWAFDSCWLRSGNDRISRMLNNDRKMHRILSIRMNCTKICHRNTGYYIKFA